jgi:hypothetical protein
MLRHSSLEDALVDLEAGSLTGVVRIVVSRGWWDGLPRQEQYRYQVRCRALHVALFADEHMSPHYVEVSYAADDPPLSSEHPI